MQQLALSPHGLGSVIRRQRKAKGLTQTQVGNLCRLQQKTISDIENGMPGTRLDTLYRLLGALDLEIMIQTKPTSALEGYEGEW